MSSIIEKVETFIQRLHDMDYIFTPEAKGIWYVSPSRPLYPSPLSPPKERKNLTDYLAIAISDYEENRDDEQHRLSYARTCLLWINRAFASGVIQEGKGLISKNKELERDVKHLRKRLDECNKRRQIVEKQNQWLHKLIPKDTFTGDLSNE